MRRVSLICVIIVCLFMCGTACAGDLTGGVSFRPVVTRTILDNGLTLLVVENHAAPVVAARLYVKTGSIYEGKYLGSGISHYFEHLLSSGTTWKRPERESRKLIEMIGGASNAYTTRDHTCYFLETTTEHQKTALDLLADWAMNCALAPYEVEREKGVIIKEINMGKDEPGKVLYNLLSETMFLNHPVRYPVIGHLDNFQAITRDDLVDYYRRYYSPNNSVLAVAGDVDPATVATIVKELFGSWKRQPVPSKLLPEEPRQMGRQYAEKFMDVGLSYMKMAFHSIKLSHPDLFALDLLSHILSEGKSSRFYRIIKDEKQLCHQIYSYSQTPSYGAGAFVIHMALEDGKLADAENAILAEIERLYQEPVTEEELAKAKVQKVSGSIFYNQSIDDLAGDVAGNEMSTGNPLFTAYYVDEIQKVTTEQIRRVAKKYLHRDNLTVVAVRPKASAEATGEKADAGETTREVRKLTLDNGLTLLLKRNPALPLVSMQAYGKAGVRLETETTNGYTRFMTKMLLKGTGKRTADEIAAAAERLGGSIDSSSGNNSFSVEVDVLSRDLEEGVEIISDVILNAAFPEEEIGKVREELLAEIKRRDDDWRLEADAFFRQVFFIDHPYRLLPGGTEEAVAAAGRDDLISFYRRYVVPDNMVLAVFGDIDVEKTETLLDKYFAGMARSELKLPPVKAAPFSEQARQLFKKNEKEQCSITIGYPGCTVHDEDRYALLVADSVLSGIVYPHGWFHEALRGKENLVYYVHATNWLGLEPGSFHVLTQTPPDKVERVVTLLRREYERIKEELVSDDELENAKNNCITMDRLGKQTNSAQAGGAALNELYGLGFDFSEKMPEKVRAVTAEDVRRVARKYFKGEVLAVVGPSVPESLVPTKKK